MAINGPVKAQTHCSSFHVQITARKVYWVIDSVKVGPIFHVWRSHDIPVYTAVGHGQSQLSRKVEKLCALHHTFRRQ